jgi:rhamnosyl/mannosyltransferase
MKVLHFYKSYYPDEYGGVQQVIRQLAEGGRAHGWEAEVLTLTPGTPGIIEAGGCRVHRVKRLFKAASTDFAFRALTAFKRLASGADLVHYHFPYPLADAAHFWAAHHKPCLVTYHSDIVAQKHLLGFYRPLMKRFLRAVPAIVATSPNYLASSLVLRDFQEKTRCIPLGLAPASPHPPELLENWRGRLPERFFLFIGAFRYYKGLDFLLTAAKGLPIPILLVGEGGGETALRARAVAEGLDNVRFLGAVSDADKEALLCLCYGLVLPSHVRSEAFGLVLLEAARRGKPLISCEIATGTTYINIHNETGLVAPPADPAALKAALLTLWENQGLAARLGEGARRRYESLFTGEKMVRGYVDLYGELTTRSRRPSP